MVRTVKYKSILKHKIIVEDIDIKEYERLVDWIGNNIPTTERYTPNYRESGSMRFGFVCEEYAMAFKLILT